MHGFSVLCCLAGAKLWAENHRGKQDAICEAFAGPTDFFGQTKWLRKTNAVDKLQPSLQ